MTSAARIRLGFRIFVLGSVATILAATPLLSADNPSGYRPAATAIQGAKIVAGPDSTIENGTIVVRAGRIEAVGPRDQISVPVDAETIDGKGLVVYPGFIDLFTTIGQAPNAVRSQSGTGRPVDYKQAALARTTEDNRNGLTPEFEVASAVNLSESQAADRRKLGFTDLLAAPAGAIATGQSALISTSGGSRREMIVRSPIALHINLRAPFEPAPPSSNDDDHAAPSTRIRSLGRYPSVLMGAVAHLRQAMLDAERQQALKVNVDPAAGAPRFVYDPTLETLQAARTKTLPVWWEANTRDEIHRVLDLAEEFGTTAVIVGGREAGKVVDRLKALNVPVVLRLDFPEEPKVPSEADYRKRELAERTEPYQVLIDRATRWKEQLATAQVLAKAGLRFAFASDGLAKIEQFPGQLRKLMAAGSLSRESALAALTKSAAEIAGVDPLLGTLEPGKLGHLVVLSAPFGDDEAKVRFVLIDGDKFEVEKSSGSKKAEEAKPSTPRAEAKGETPKSKSEEAKPKEVAKAEATPKAATPPPPRTIEDQPSQTPFLDVATEFDHNRKPKLETKGNVLIKDATILTITKEGTIAKGSILIQNGKIAAVGPELTAPEGVTVIDATGLVAMPGIIDSHSHIAIQGGGNEWSLSVVPEVRIKDVITGDDPAIYRALAGGTTTARILHGSADTIGGQDAVIKLKYHLPARDLILKDAPQGIKFALGENVTRNPGRFPNTRMGVEATIDRAFQEARVYQEQWKAFETAKAAGKPPVLPLRRDLRLEALARVLDGSIKIHSHCYRSDEILMLMRVAARHGVRVQSLQHVLEGYKVAPEIAAHGAAASTFSDWWAYKVEAFDAIPYNAALLAEAGVSVSIKSDSEELIRHLNLEAAKMVKYGGVTEAQALAMITINPARELGLQDRLGSIEVGKDADIALFNAHPFDAFARCELSLIDGEVWFQRSEKNGKFALRPGDHKAMPTASQAARGRVLEIGRNPEAVYALIGATIHPVSGPEINNGTLVISEGKITAVGDSGTAVPSSAQTIDLQGFDLWPGMVDAGTRLGVFEVNSLPETQDDADSAQFEPELRTSSALHPDSEIIPVSRANGILSAYVQPSGGLISGQGCVIDLNGWVPREMVIADPVALHVAIPRYIPPEIEGPGSRREGPDPIKKRTELLDSIVEEFQRALAYDKVLSDSKEKEADAPATDLRLAALVPYAKGRKPVIFHAEHRAEILDALTIAGTLKLKAIVSGGADAWKVAEALKAAKVPVLVGGTLRIPGEPSDPYDAPYANPARLHEAGVRFAIRSNPSGAQQATASRNLPYEAATAVAFGLPEAEAVKAVTLAPAEILGVADQVGSLETGKRANLVITAGHLLQPTTEVKAIFLDGKPIDPKSRHTRLFEKYRRRLAEVRAGTAILGLDIPNTPAAPTPAPTAETATPPATKAPSGQD